MIKQKISDSVTVIFTSNRFTNIDGIKKELNCSDKDIINNSYNYNPQGSNSSILCTKIESKAHTYYVLNDLINFRYSSPNELIEKLKSFGNKYSIRNNQTVFEGEFFVHDFNHIKNHKNETILLNTVKINRDDTNISRFIHRMKMDNGRMLQPIIQRYYNTIMLFKNNKKFLTGYANLSNYLEFIKQPSSAILELMKATENTSTANYIMNLKNNSEIKLKVFGVVNDKLVIDIIFDGLIEKNGKKNNQQLPYVIMTTKPIVLLNQKIPYFIVHMNKVPIFLSPLLLNNTDLVKEMKGGIDLLK